MDWMQAIEAAHLRISPHIRRTPVMQATLAGHDLALKLEQAQHTGSFKARGAFNSLLSLPVPAAGVVAASGGNHGAAVAFSANRLGHKAKVFVPEFAGAAKIGLIRRSSRSQAPAVVSATATAGTASFS